MPAQPEDHVVQAGVIPFRTTSSEIEVALVTSRSGERWLFPKGHVESRESLVDTAAREAFEEAGVTGHVHPDCIGQYSYVKLDRPYQVHLFPMHVGRTLSCWPECGKRLRIWTNIRDAATRIWHDDLTACVLALPMTLRAVIGSDSLPTLKQTLRSVA